MLSYTYDNKILLQYYKKVKKGADWKKLLNTGTTG